MFSPLDDILIVEMSIEMQLEAETLDMDQYDILLGIDDLE